MPQMVQKVTAHAYAKINWLLDVGSARADGFHELSTIFQTIDLYDLLDFELADTLSLTLTNRDLVLAVDDSNLIIRAAKALQPYSKISSSTKIGAKIVLDKRIPMGGGLGGGSANAAVTLMALNQLWQCELPLSTLVELGAKLGSDVPFFFYGGTALGVGRGTDITPMDDIEAPFLLLVNAGVEVATKAAYQEFDRLTNQDAIHILPPYFSLTADELFSQVRNSLSTVAVKLQPVIAEVEAELKRLGGQPVLMSGSGATVWARFSTSEQRAVAMAALKSKKWLVIATSALHRDLYRSSVLKVREL